MVSAVDFHLTDVPMVVVVVCDRVRVLGPHCWRRKVQLLLLLLGCDVVCHHVSGCWPLVAQVVPFDPYCMRRGLVLRPWLLVDERTQACLPEVRSHMLRRRGSSSRGLRREISEDMLAGHRACAANADPELVTRLEFSGSRQRAAKRWLGPIRHLYRRVQIRQIVVGPAELRYAAPGLHDVEVAHEHVFVFWALALNGGCGALDRRGLVAELHRASVGAKLRPDGILLSDTLLINRGGLEDDPALIDFLVGAEDFLMELVLPMRAYAIL